MYEYFMYCFKLKCYMVFQIYENTVLQFINLKDAIYSNYLLQQYLPL